VQTEECIITPLMGSDRKAFKYVQKEKNAYVNPVHTILLRRGVTATAFAILCDGSGEENIMPRVAVI